MLRIASLLVCLFLSSTTFAGDWSAGAAKVKITPRQPMWMSGYASRKAPAEGTQTDLFAKALVLQDGSGHKAVIVTLDLVGIPREISQAVSAALREKHGFDRRDVALCVSHTHCGPIVGSNLRTMVELSPEQDKLLDDYALELQANLVQVVDEAVKAVAPAELAWGNGQTTFAVNRRNNKEAEVPAVRERGGLVGPVDYDVPVLSVRGADGKLRAVLFGYACHATVLSFNNWCGDYPGYAQAELEKLHPETVALFFAGCGADQNPLPRREVALAEHYGRTLAGAVEATLTGVMTPVAGSLGSAYEEIPLAFDKLPTGADLAAAEASTNVYEARRAKMLIKKLGEGKLSETYPYPVQVWRLGEGLQFVTLGGEVVVDYSLRLKHELGQANTWVAGYSNDVMAYIPSLRVLKEGGYEGGGSMVYYGQPSIWSEAVEESIITAVHKLSQATAK